MSQRLDGIEAGQLACVILSHADPRHVRRLIRALDPFPVVLHCDKRSPAAVYQAMVDALPARVQLLPRRVTGWATWGVVDAEIEGYRAALASSPASHVALLTGSDYPLASTQEISSFLADHVACSIARYHPLPYPEWGRSGGMARLRYQHYAYRKRMIRVPVPRRMPSGIALWGGSQLKVLARHHAQALVDVADSRPDLVRFWRRSWVPDESFAASVLNTSSLVPDWQQRHIDDSLWYIGWAGPRRKSPPWCDIGDLDTLIEARTSPPYGMPRMFARKFSSMVDTAVLDAIDEALRIRRVG